MRVSWPGPNSSQTFTDGVTWSLVTHLQGNYPDQPKLGGRPSQGPNTGKEYSRDESKQMTLLRTRRSTYRLRLNDSNSNILITP